MAKKHGEWTIKGTERLYKDDFVEFHVDEVIKPDGKPSRYAVMEMVPGISVLALDDEGFVHLHREFRYAIGRESLEVVSGAIDEGEEPARAARRELNEEHGIEAGELIDLGTIDAVTSQVLCPSSIFLARRLKFGEPDLDGSERIEPVKMTLAEAVAAVMDGRITHALSCVLILKAQQYLQAERARG